jgi:hypothetical protein
MLKAGLALFAAAWILLGTGNATAAPTGLNVSQSCSGNTANMTFTWRGVAANSQQVWIDLTTNDNWRAGTYISAGPFAASDTSFVWSGIKANQLHYFRMTEQLANGSWVASVTSSFTAVCGAPANSGATPEEQSYRNRATAQLTALAVRIVQTPRSSRTTLVATLNDFVTTLNGLEPVPPRFRDVHYQLRDVMAEFVSCARSNACSRAELEDLLDEIEDALDDYSLVVGI